MIEYVTLGANDMKKSAAYYDELSATIGVARFMVVNHFIAWATSEDTPELSTIKPYDGNKLAAFTMATE